MKVGDNRLNNKITQGKVTAMTLASTSLAQLRYIPETTPGVTPTTGNCIDLRLTGESLDLAVQAETSKEIRSDRQTTDLVHVGASCQGGFNFELSAREYDAFIEAVLQGEWIDYGTGGKGPAMTLDIDSTDRKLIAGTAPNGANAFSKLSSGQWLRLTAPGDLADGSFLKIASAGGTTITIDAASPIPGTGTRSVSACVISASRAANGVNQRYFTMEKEFSDVGQYLAYRGMTPSKLSLSFEPGSIVNGSFEFLGFKASDMTPVSNLPGTPIPPQTYDVMNSVNGVGQLIEAGMPMTDTFIQSLSLDLDNALRGQTAIGHFGFVGIAAGTLVFTGSMRVYLKDAQAYNNFIANRASSISWHVRDGSNNGYVFTLPKLKYSGGKVVAGAINQDVLLEMPFTALMDATSRKTLFIDRLYQ
jgi:hypothetical protein